MVSPSDSFLTAFTRTLDSITQCRSLGAEHNGWSRIYAPSRKRGALYYLIASGVPTTTAVIAQRVSRSCPLLHTGLLAAGTWTVLGGTTLQRVGHEMEQRLRDGTLEADRELLPSLCSRDPQYLDVEGIARATVESLAENTSDATIGALFWGAIAGLPGLLWYRATNTLDAMVGYRSARYRDFGWASARMDDVANYVPARLTALLTAAIVPQRAREILHLWRRDAPTHPSSNAGVVEIACAGALGITLGGETIYRYGVENRPRLGDGPVPTCEDLAAAVRLSGAVQWAGLCVALILAAVMPGLLGGAPQHCR
ncbi:Cobalamin biosynthesis protein CobD [Lawsonella clevelandensis]|uniref:Cobalamin biosynthesis protein CobD n=1 Tax=Lawsonella clevelandensis TaxID=1528099 RepID=A0A5E3ZZ17_9ACTN|nr:Cobalamin biosynthesis protein CobD [Lawsonella clevelandensis]